MSEIANGNACLLPFDQSCPSWLLKQHFFRGPNKLDIFIDNGNPFLAVDSGKPLQTKHKTMETLGALGPLLAAQHVVPLAVAPARCRQQRRRRVWRGLERRLQDQAPRHLASHFWRSASVAPLWRRCSVKNVFVGLFVEGVVGMVCLVSYCSSFLSFFWGWGGGCSHCPPLKHFTLAPWSRLPPTLSWNPTMDAAYTNTMYGFQQLSKQTLEQITWCFDASMEPTQT